MILALAALIAASALLIAVVRVGASLVSGWLESVLQILIALPGIVAVRYLWLQTIAASCSLHNAAEVSPAPTITSGVS